MITKGNRLGGQPSKTIAATASTMEHIPLEEKVFNEDWLNSFTNHKIEKSSINHRRKI